jgi:hypothetical protein
MHIRILLAIPGPPTLITKELPVNRYLVSVFCAFLALAGPVVSAKDPPSAVIRPAAPLRLPGVSNPEHQWDAYVDCNNPVHWDGPVMYIFSSAGHPWRSSGPDLLHLDPVSRRTAYDNEPGYNGGRWIEATFKHADGRLYGWYHREPAGVCGKDRPLTAPQIGAVVSSDNGMHWKDLGIVLQAPADSLDCATPNRYFASGNGDFSVIPGRDGRFLYFLISTYHRDVREQGFSLARMGMADLDAPVGKAFKWHQGEWREPGLGGHVTPVFPAAGDWHSLRVDAFWGPSVHWNSHLGEYVVLLNRARDKDWAQEGIYATFNADLAHPEDWSRPVKLLDAAQLELSKWYPQVVGVNAARRETDKLAGRTARLFVAGRSKWEIVFLKPGEAAASRGSEAP